MDALNLPGAWSSTANANESLCFHAKDVVIVIDDFCPTGSSFNQQRAHADADRLLRAQGNRAGRHRMRSDGSLQPPKPPRGLIVSTGEDLPKGASLRARILDIAVGPGEVNLGVVTECQGYARTGIFAQVTSGFIQWLAPQYEELRQRLPDKVAYYRQQTQTASLHSRTPEIVGHLLSGLDYFQRFTVARGALSQAEADALWDRGAQAILEVAEAQQVHQVTSDPVGRFLELLRTALVSGRCHLASTTLLAPPNAEAWGWRLCSIDPQELWQAQGKRSGWVDGENVYLFPDAVYAAVQTLAREGNDTVMVTSQTLWKRLREKNLLLSVDQSRKTNTVRHMLAGVRRAVLHLHVNTLFGEEPPI